MAELFLFESILDTNRYITELVFGVDFLEKSNLKTSKIFGKTF